MTKRFAKVRESRAAFTAISIGSIAVMGMLLVGGCAKKEEDAPPAAATQPKAGQGAPGAAGAPTAAPVGATPIQPKS